MPDLTPLGKYLRDLHALRVEDRARAALREQHPTPWDRLLKWMKKCIDIP